MTSPQGHSTDHLSVLSFLDVRLPLPSAISDRWRAVSRQSRAQPSLCFATLTAPCTGYTSSIWKLPRTCSQSQPRILVCSVSPSAWLSTHHQWTRNSSLLSLFFSHSILTHSLPSSTQPYVKSDRLSPHAPTDSPSHPLSFSFFLSRPARTTLPPTKVHRRKLPAILRSPNCSRNYQSTTTNTTTLKCDQIGLYEPLNPKFDCYILFYHCTLSLHLLLLCLYYYLLLQIYSTVIMSSRTRPSQRTTQP